MDNKKPIDRAEYITLEDAKRLKLPYFEGLAAGFPSPAGDYRWPRGQVSESWYLSHTQAPVPVTRTVDYCRYFDNIPKLLC